MNLHTLKPATGSKKGKKRIGRGQGSGRGGTATRGHKGAKSRSGYSQKLGFEGGQMPLQRRVPKFGFKSPNRVEYVAVNLINLQNLVDTHGVSEFSQEEFVRFGIASKRDKVKVLGTGELNTKIKVSAHAFSATALVAIEKVGGEAIKL